VLSQFISASLLVVKRTHVMGKHLKKGEQFLRFLLDAHTSKQERKHLLLNLTEVHLSILSEILFNLLKNQEIFHISSKKVIKKYKRFLNTFSILAKRKNKLKQRQFLKKNLKKIFLILKTFRKIILNFLQ
jgi:uncharacterized membrane protein